MATHKAKGTDAATLVALLETIDKLGERPVLMQEAGDSWVVVTEKRPGRPPGKPELRS
jgi:hypothetical protein